MNLRPWADSRGSRPAWSASNLLVATILVAVHSVARLWPLNGYRLWFDEIYSLQVIHRDFGGLVRFVATYDPHPPFWYMLLKAWTALAGESFLSLGVFAAIPAILLPVPLFLLARELRLPPMAANGALALMTLNGYLLGTAQELRMYSLLALLTGVSIWLTLRFLHDERPSQWIGIGLMGVNLLVVFTQYFGWVTIGLETLLLLRHPRRLGIFLAGTVCVGAMTLAWLRFVLEAAGPRLTAGQEAIAFSSAPTLFSVLWFYANLAGNVTIAHGTTIACVLAMVPVAFWGLSLVRSGRGDHAFERHVFVTLALCAAGPVVLAVIASHVLPFSVWGQRHLVIVAVPFALLLAAAGVRLSITSTRRFQVAWATVALGWLAAGSVESLRAPTKEPAWDRLVTELRACEGVTEVPIYSVNSSAGYVAQFYLQRYGVANFRSAVVKPTARSLTGRVKPYWALELPLLVVPDLSGLPGDHFWVADDGGNDGEGTTAWGASPSIKTLLAAAGYRVGPALTATVVIRRWNQRLVELFPVWRVTPTSS